MLANAKVPRVYPKIALLRHNMPHHTPHTHTSHHTHIHIRLVSLTDKEDGRSTILGIEMACVGFVGYLRRFFSLFLAAARVYLD